MEFHFRRPLVFLSAAILAAAFAAPHSIAAQKADHLVSPGDLDKAAQQATQVRQQNIDALRDFLSSPQAQKALEQAHINPVEVQNAVSGLSDQELAQLAARADKARNDFAAGNMTDHDLLVILVAVAVIILIIVAVH
jgi:dihydrodipicolinate reductase